VIHLRNELLQHLEEQFPEHIVEAFKKVPREEFVPDKHRKYAYADIALPIGEEQTISQPTTIAFMLQLLDTAPDHTVLELGSGGGYVLALLSVLAKNGQVYGVEIQPPLAKKAGAYFENMKHVTVINKNGRGGLAEHAPFDRIIASASWDEPPLHLAAQLKEGGVLVAPVLDAIWKIKKKDGELIKQQFDGFRFVPFV
jgi:protein-L-isoaspartate(D-aspartate) O-methyltransferase